MIIPNWKTNLSFSMLLNLRIIIFFMLYKIYIPYGLAVSANSCKAIKNVVY